MAKYCNEWDCVDPLLSVSGLNREAADSYVDLALGALDITPAMAETIALPNPILTTIAATWAKNLAAIEAMTGDSPTMRDKAAGYKSSAEAMVRQLSKVALGISMDEEAGTSYASVRVSRG